MPGSDARRDLEEYFRSQHLSAAVVTGAVGSVSALCLRLAQASDPTHLSGPFEITSLSGTLSSEGAHLHIALADIHGNCLGGHLLHGAIVYTTLEVTVLSLPELAFRRSIDPGTTFHELNITRLLTPQ